MSTPSTGPVVVTGGARGIGRAVAEHLLDGGRPVAVLDRDTDSEDGWFERRRAGEVPVSMHRADVTDEASIVAALADARSVHGAVTGLVNNAGVNAYGDVTAMTTEAWEQVFAVDLRGAWLCAKHVVDDLRAAGGGAIVNVASLHAKLTTRGMFPYAAAKSGLVGLTRSMALELADDAIRVNAVSPGYIGTALVEEYLDGQPDPEQARREVLAAQPLGRLGTPEDVAAVIGFLLGDGAAYVTGADWAVDGGFGVRFA